MALDRFPFFYFVPFFIFIRFCNFEFSPPTDFRISGHKFGSIYHGRHISLKGGECGFAPHHPSLCRYIVHPPGHREPDS